ncbi:hypothetical protein SKAU_G00366960 [Synaphobranchus kaupii]|uniref:Uncharacterized protein n=1 Tax=Synaphobranchus kaupii TaxID=118154 RepID=A0A9Q1EFD1_SYNKA|nr:hypothetical protein SKAU_G00366960 [Synaphobranchus kaupii]
MISPKWIHRFTPGNLALLNESGPAGDWKECRIFFLKCHVVELWRRITKKCSQSITAMDWLPGRSLEVLSPPISQ